MSESEKRLDTVRLQEIVQGFWRSGALMAAVELGLFTAVSKGAGTYAEAATALDITETNAERLMTACVTLELFLTLNSIGKLALEFVNFSLNLDALSIKVSNLSLNLAALSNRVSFSRRLGATST